MRNFFGEDRYRQGKHKERKNVSIVSTFHSINSDGVKAKSKYTFLFACTCNIVQCLIKKLRIGNKQSCDKIKFLKQLQYKIVVKTCKNRDEF